MISGNSLPNFSVSRIIPVSLLEIADSGIGINVIADKIHFHKNRSLFQRTVKAYQGS